MAPTQLPFSPLPLTELNRRTDESALRTVWVLHDCDDVSRAREHAAETVACHEAAVARVRAEWAS